MTREDLQRDVEILQGLREDCAFYAGPRSRVATLDRAIEFARIRASMSDEQRAQVAEGCAGVATTFASIDPILADAHRKVARLMGAR